MPIPMWLGARLPGAEFTLLADSSAASWASHQEAWLFLGCHEGIMKHYLRGNCSIVIRIASESGVEAHSSMPSLLLRISKDKPETAK